MVLNYIPQTINVYFISRVGDADMVAGVGLATLVSRQAQTLPEW